MSKEAEDSRIEISGWDRDDIFFAEIADVFFEPTGEKKIALRSNLRLRSVVFARPVASVTPGKILPATYLVVQVKPQDPEGCSEVRLVQICPSSDVSLRAKPASYMPEDSRGAREPADGSAQWIEEEILR